MQMWCRLGRIGIHVLDYGRTLAEGAPSDVLRDPRASLRVSGEGGLGIAKEHSRHRASAAQLPSPASCRMA